MEDDAIEAVEGWFMDRKYSPDRTFWQMATEILEYLTKAGYTLVRPVTADEEAQNNW